MVIRWFASVILIANLFASTFVFAEENKPLTLSLDEAILLAVRSNPNVQSSKLSYVSQKFNTYVQQWQFYPHYSFQASTVQELQGANSHNIQPGVSLLTPIGTQINLNANTQTNQSRPALSMQVMQPLMRGFGMAVVEAALNNAKDSQRISALNIEGTLRNTVTGVINAYLDVVSAEKNIQIDQGALQRAERSVRQTKLYIKAGHKAGNEIVTVQANAATARSQLENDRNNLDQARYALLAAIGMDPNTSVKFTSLDVRSLINKYHMPSREQAKNLVLENDIQYQTDEITLHGATSRNLLVAEDNTRWQLNATGNLGTGNGSGQVRSAGLTLQIPIDDQVAKQGVMNAKIGLKQAELALMQEKWNKETNAINGWNSVLSAERALHYAEDAEKLQERTYNLNYQKYLHGLIDSLELQSALTSLIQAQQATLNAYIGYLKALVNLDLLVGNTLRTWDIKARM